MIECRFAATADGYALSGRLVYANAAAAYAEGLRLLCQRPAANLHVAAIESIDSAGVAVLLAWLSALRAQGALTKITGLPAQAAALARVGGVLSLFEKAEA